MMLVAAAAMASVSCQKEEHNAQEEYVTLTFASENPVTKTHWDGQTVTWSSEDAIRVALMIGDTWYHDNSGAKLYQSNKLKSDNQTAKFSVTDFKAEKITEGNWTGAYQFYGLYPASAEDANFGKTASKASIEIPTEQTLSSDTFDKSADILWGKAVDTYSSLPSSDVSMVWDRVVAHACISLNDIKGIVPGEIVKKITFIAQSDADLTGGYELHMVTGEFTPKSSATNKVVLASSEGITLAGDDLTFWACVNPCTLTELDIEVDTDKAVYTIKKTDFSRDFKVNQRNILPIDMSTATRTAKEVSEINSYYVKVTAAPADWSGTYLLVAEKSGSFYVFNQTIDSNWGRLTSVDVVDNKISSVAVSGFEMSVESGSSPGTYAFKINSGKYLSASAKDKINTQDSKGVNTDMEITLQNDGTVVISYASKSERTLQCNVNTKYGFRFYDNGAQVNPQLYKLQSN